MRIEITFTKSQLIKDSVDLSITECDDGKGELTTVLKMDHRHTELSYTELKHLTAALSVAVSEGFQ